MKQEEEFGEDAAALKRALENWESITADMLSGLQNAGGSATWEPHRGQITAAVGRFRDMCRAELERCAWRRDGCDPAEMHEAVWHQCDELTRWLARMTQPL